MEHERLAVGVLEQVEQLVVKVAVVDVDRDVAPLEGGELRLGVLDAVVEVEPDLRVVTASPAPARAPARRAERASHSPQVRRSSPMVTAKASGWASAMALPDVRANVASTGALLGPPIPAAEWGRRRHRQPVRDPGTHGSVSR